MVYNKPTPPRNHGLVEDWNTYIYGHGIGCSMLRGKSVGPVGPLQPHEIGGLGFSPLSHGGLGI